MFVHCAKIVHDEHSSQDISPYQLCHGSHLSLVHVNIFPTTNRRQDEHVDDDDCDYSNEYEHDDDYEDENDDDNIDDDDDYNIDDDEDEVDYDVDDDDDEYGDDEEDTIDDHKDEDDDG